MSIGASPWRRQPSEILVGSVHSRAADLCSNTPLVVSRENTRIGKYFSMCPYGV